MKAVTVVSDLIAQKHELDFKKRDSMAAVVMLYKQILLHIYDIPRLKAFMLLVQFTL